MRIKGDGTSFGYEFFTTLPTWVQGDEKKLWCVLEYLLGNAIEYQDDVIILKVNDHKEKIRFEIEMRSPKTSEKPSFVHPAPTQPPPTGSLSLRLSISKLLVELMGGKLTYENREDNLNRIDVFWFELNLPEVEPPSEEANI